MTPRPEPLSTLERRLVDAFEHRAAVTTVTGDRPAVHRLTEDASGHPRRRRLAVAGLSVAAASIALAGIALHRGDDGVRVPAASDGTSVTIAPVEAPSLAITDPLAISLDGWIDPLWTPPDGEYVVLDTSAFHPDATADDEFGGTSLAAPPDDDQSISYTYGATIVAAGETYRLTVSRRMFGMCGYLVDDDRVIGTEPADVVDGEVCWEVAAGVTASLTDDDGANVDETALLALAGELRFRVVEALPAPQPTDEPDEVRSPYDPIQEGTELAFGGTIDGHRWEVYVDPGVYRAMWLTVDGFASSGFESGSDSQVAGTPLTSTEANNVDGVPGGVVLYGAAPAGVASIVVERRDGATATLPAIPRELESFWAVPVPTSVDISTIRMLDANGAIVAELAVPTLPPQLSGGYGGFLQPPTSEPPA